jgi:ankyrin repeat protein
MQIFTKKVISTLILLYYLFPRGNLYSQDEENYYSSLTSIELNEAFLNTLSHEASLEDVQEFLSAGADVNIQGRNDYTPLMMALDDDNRDVVILLLEAGADVNACTEKGITPLRIAVLTRDNLEIIRLLLDAGADVNAGDNTGTTPLMIALQREFNIDVVNLLLDSGADVMARDNRGRCPEDLVSYFEGHEIKQLMKTLTRRGKVVETLDIDDYIELFIEEPVIETAQAYLDAGGDPNALNDEGLSPFLFACGFGADFEIIKLFLSHGADAVQVIQDGWTPLLLAAASDAPDWETFKLLIEAGADVNQKSEHGFTPFLYAVSQRMTTEVLGSLLAAGAELNAVNKMGKTALMMAAEDRNTQLVEFLIDSGAEPGIEDEGGKKLWDYVQKYELTYGMELYNRIKILSGEENADFAEKVTAEELFEIMEYVSINPQTIMNYIKSGGDVNVINGKGDTLLILAGISAEYPKVFELLISAGADVNAVNKIGMTPVFAAIYNQLEKPDLIKLLVDAGADININDNNGLTPLILALSRNKSPAIINLLLNEEVVNQSEQNGWTPLMVASGNQNPEMTKIIPMLLNAGAEIDIRNSNGLTALRIATEHQPNIDILSLLVSAGADASITDNTGRSALDYMSENEVMKETELYYQLKKHN